MPIKMEFEVSEKAAGNMGGMMAFLGINKSELLNYSLTLLEWYIKQLREGQIVASVDEDNKKYKELSLGELNKKVQGG